MKPTRVRRVGETKHLNQINNFSETRGIIFPFLKWFCNICQTIVDLLDTLNNGHSCCNIVQWSWLKRKHDLVIIHEAFALVLQVLLKCCTIGNMQRDWSIRVCAIDFPSSTNYSIIITCRVLP